MQAINVAVINRWFLVPFLGMAVACVLLIIAALVQWNDPGAAHVLAGGLFYLIGAFVVTMIFNVPAQQWRWRPSSPPARKARCCGRALSSSGRGGTM